MTPDDTPDPTLCSWEGCRQPARASLAFRNQPGHVHNCPTHEAFHREWCDVIESAPLPNCPWGHGTTWVDTPVALA